MFPPNLFEAKLARRLGVVVFIGFKPEILPNWGCTYFFDRKSAALTFGVAMFALIIGVMILLPLRL